MGLYIGVMSGTSMDGVDAVLCEITSTGCQTLAKTSVDYSASLLATLHRLCQTPDAGLRDVAQADILVAQTFATAVNQLLKETQQPASTIAAIGSHGQTIAHYPQATPPYTVQIGDLNTLASQTGITAIGDFRRKDIALGGQGAPLAPAFHRFQFAHPERIRVIVNIGGIANITLLPAHSETVSQVIGYDTGPGNTLMDAWIKTHRGSAFDSNGQWANSGTVNTSLLNLLLADVYFSQPYPKSTGREYFNLNWLAQRLQIHQTSLSPQDVQATLLELTCRTIVEAVMTHCGLADKTFELVVCGGGAFNTHLMTQLRERCQQYNPNCSVVTSDALGVHPQWVEGAAFAWLAWAHQHQQHGNIPSVTGASRHAVLGVCCPP